MIIDSAQYKLNDDNQVHICMYIDLQCHMPYMSSFEKYDYNNYSHT